MAPVVLGGEGVGAAIGAFRGGRAAAGAALRELPGTLAKHAVAPGIAIQTLEEAFPGEQSGANGTESLSGASSGSSSRACGEATPWQAGRALLKVWRSQLAIMMVWKKETFEKWAYDFTDPFR
jgi:hypothetical protein